MKKHDRSKIRAATIAQAKHVANTSAATTSQVLGTSKPLKTVTVKSGHKPREVKEIQKGTVPPTAWQSMKKRLKVTNKHRQEQPEFAVSPDIKTKSGAPKKVLLNPDSVGPGSIIFTGKKITRKRIIGFDKKGQAIHINENTIGKNLGSIAKGESLDEHVIQPKTSTGEWKITTSHKKNRRAYAEETAQRQALSNVKKTKGRLDTTGGNTRTSITTGKIIHTGAGVIKHKHTKAQSGYIEAAKRAGLDTKEAEAINVYFAERSDKGLGGYGSLRDIGTGKLTFIPGTNFKSTNKDVKLMKHPEKVYTAKNVRADIEAMRVSGSGYSSAPLEVKIGNIVKTVNESVKAKKIATERHNAIAKKAMPEAEAFHKVANVGAEKNVALIHSNTPKSLSDDAPKGGKVFSATILNSVGETATADREGVTRYTDTKGKVQEIKNKHLKPKDWATRTFISYGKAPEYTMLKAGGIGGFMAKKFSPSSKYPAPKKSQVFNTRTYQTSAQQLKGSTPKDMASAAKERFTYAIQEGKFNVVERAKRGKK